MFNTANLLCNIFLANLVYTILLNLLNLILFMHYIFSKQHFSLIYLLKFHKENLRLKLYYFFP